MIRGTTYVPGFWSVNDLKVTVLTDIFAVFGDIRIVVGKAIGNCCNEEKLLCSGGGICPAFPTMTLNGQGPPADGWVRLHIFQRASQLTGEGSWGSSI